MGEDMRAMNFAPWMCYILIEIQIGVAIGYDAFVLKI
jgi:hypothetical protein